MKLNLLLLSAALFNAATATETVDLRSAGNYVILAKSGISTVPQSAITGDIGVSPVTATAITGFSLTMHSDNEYSTATQVTGKCHGATYATPTPYLLTTAVGDMMTAYKDAESRSADQINFQGGHLGGQTLTSGVYKFASNIDILSTMYFTGTADDIFIIQTTGDLLQATNTNVILLEGAQAKNIFWQIAGQSVVEAGAHMEGIILIKTDALFKTGSSLNGRVLSQTACDLQMATIVEV